MTFGGEQHFTDEFRAADKKVTVQEFSVLPRIGQEKKLTKADTANRYRGSVRIC
jgi:hypothetical protein